MPAPPATCCLPALQLFFRLPAANLQDIPDYPAKYNVKTMGARGDGNAGGSSSDTMHTCPTRSAPTHA